MIRDVWTRQRSLDMLRVGSSMYDQRFLDLVKIFTYVESRNLTVKILSVS